MPAKSSLMSTATPSEMNAASAYMMRALTMEVFTVGGRTGQAIWSSTVPSSTPSPGLASTAETEPALGAKM
jgi:hypothetical protein